MIRTMVLAIVAGATMIGCQSGLVAEPSQTLSASEVQRLFVGNTVESFNRNTRLTSFTYYHPNGQALQERLWARRTGRWSIRQDGQICLAFGKKPLKCRHIVLDRERYYKVRPDKSGKPEKIIRYRYFANGNALTDR